MRARAQSAAPADAAMAEADGEVADPAAAAAAASAPPAGAAARPGPARGTRRAHTHVAMPEAHARSSSEHCVHAAWKTWPLKVVVMAFATFSLTWRPVCGRCDA